jgi:hypothetical protein
MSTVFEEVLEKGKEIGVKEGKEIGLKEGVKEGEEKNKIIVALNCLMKGMDIETISEITDLPVKRIELLKTAVQEENANVCTFFQGFAKTAFKRCIIKWFFTPSVREDIQRAASMMSPEIPN